MSAQAALWEDPGNDVPACGEFHAGSCDHLLRGLEHELAPIGVRFEAYWVGAELAERC